MGGKLIVPFLFFFSGASALMAEVLWVRALAVVVGGAYQVQALVLGVFFAAIPVGAALGRRWVSRYGLRGLWRCYAVSEAASAVAALVPAAVGASIIHVGATQTMAGYLMLVVLAVPGLSVGANWPVVAALSHRQGGPLGVLYAVNTFGAGAGALGATLVLVQRFGTSGALLVSALIGSFVSVVALVASRLDSRIGAERAQEPGIAASTSRSDLQAVVRAAALSGFATIAFEVLGARLLALRLTVSSYSFALVLAVQLGGMAAGASLVPFVLRMRDRALSVALALAALGVAWAPIMASVRPIPNPADGWSATVMQCIAEAVVVLGPGALATGLLFPLASGLLPLRHRRDYRRLGSLAMVNGVCGMVAAAAVGIVLVPAIGMAWCFVVLIALIGLSAAWAAKPLGAARLWGPALLALSAVLAFGATQWSPMQLKSGEHILGEEEGPTGTAAVVENRDGIRRLVVGGRYIMGDSASRVAARRLGLLPALLKGDANSVLAIGLGTGITNGALQEFVSTNDGRLDVVELMPEVAALTAHFSTWQGRFGRSGAVHVTDGRQFLRDTRTQRDLIVFDVVHPWQPGAASLYTVEGFASVRDRLTDDGRVVVWLPIYQLSREGLAAILGTFTSVFPRARLFIAGLDSNRQVVGLASEATQDDVATENLRRLTAAGVMDDPLLSHPGAFGALDLGSVRRLLDALTASGFVRTVRILRDDRPWLEFEEARAHADQQSLGTRDFRLLLAASDRILEARGGAEQGVHRCLRAIWLDPEDEEVDPLLGGCLATSSTRALARHFAVMMARRSALAGSPSRAQHFEALAREAVP